MQLAKRTTGYFSGYLFCYFNYESFVDAFMWTLKFFWRFIEPHQEWAVPLIRGFAKTVAFIFGAT